MTTDAPVSAAAKGADHILQDSVRPEQGHLQNIINSFTLFFLKCKVAESSSSPCCFYQVSKSSDSLKIHEQNNFQTQDDGILIFFMKQWITAFIHQMMQLNSI